ncbi:MAG: GGDEF domain-containing protein [Actinomycetota bacterium]|nr:GGDEF domain-containing protein [Actinomycetota bacterium]
MKVGNDRSLELGQWLRRPSNDFWGWFVTSPFTPPIKIRSSKSILGIPLILGSLVAIAVSYVGRVSAHRSVYLIDLALLLLGVLRMLLRAENRLLTNLSLAAAVAATSYQLYLFGYRDPGELAVVFYIWIAIYTFTYLSVVESIGQILFILISYSAALEYGRRPSAPIGDWILTTATVIIAAITSGYLMHVKRSMAIRDSLTGVLNRHGWSLLVPREIERARRGDNHIVVGVIDLDNFKAINDSEGHSRGDEILKGVASNIARSVRREDLCYRLGGDEFGFLCITKSAQDAELVAKRIFDRAMSITSVSCGATITSRPYSVDELSRSADLALIDIKGSGRGRMTIEYR